jgi:hypothetical protein
MEWLYVASVSRQFILGRTPESRGTRAGFYPPVWALSATLVLLLIWAVGGFRSYTVTNLQMWLALVGSTAVTIFLTKGIGESQAVRLMAERLDSASSKQRNILRLKVWLLYLGLMALIYVTLTKVAYVPQLLGQN